MKALLIATTLALGLAACDPKKPAEPKPPTPKVDFTHERSTS
ncbi:MAG TPA: hypothetical protein VNU96_00485 [Burkholderiales bacterium]|jgi:hypothetical protein|nr:hypothetical protein [Burkholderiales bacterium]